MDEFATNTMKEDGQMRAAAPECKGQLGWVYHKNFCYMFTSYHETFLKAEEECNKVGGYLADVLTAEENDWIKSVLNVINPKDGTDYWLGGLDANKDKQMQWVTGTLFFSFFFSISRKNWDGRNVYWEKRHIRSRFRLLFKTEHNTFRIEIES